MGTDANPEELESYKGFIAWYRNEFKLSYPHGLSWDLAKQAYLAGYDHGYAKAREDVTEYYAKGGSFKLWEDMTRNVPSVTETAAQADATYAEKTAIRNQESDKRPSIPHNHRGTHLHPSRTHAHGLAHGPSSAKADGSHHA